VSEVSPGHLKFKFQRLLKKFFYWPPTKQLYGPPSISKCPFVRFYQLELRSEWVTKLFQGLRAVGNNKSFAL
jgi:hypothetical protein